MALPRVSDATRQNWRPSPVGGLPLSAGSGPPQQGKSHAGWGQWKLILTCPLGGTRERVCSASLRWGDKGRASCKEEATEVSCGVCVCVMIAGPAFWARRVAKRPSACCPINIPSGPAPLTSVLHLGAKPYHCSHSFTPVVRCRMLTLTKSAAENISCYLVSHCAPECAKHWSNLKEINSLSLGSLLSGGRLSLLGKFPLEFNLREMPDSLGKERMYSFIRWCKLCSSSCSPCFLGTQEAQRLLSCSDAVAGLGWCFVAFSFLFLVKIFI